MKVTLKVNLKVEIAEVLIRTAELEILERIRTPPPKEKERVYTNKFNVKMLLFTL